jgi:vitamin B12 transporter
MHAPLIRRACLPIVAFSLCAGVIAASAWASPASASASPSPTPSATPVASLGDVFVTAQRHDTGQRGTTRQTFVLTSTDLAMLGAVTVADALALIPGADVNSYGTDGHLQTAFLRGASSTETLVLINGRPANEPGVGLFDFSSLPVDAIDRVEVVEGAASTLWGSAAMGGVINIITKDPSYGSHGSAGAGVGFEGASWSDVDVSAGDSRGAGISVSLSDRHSLDALSYPAFAGAPAGYLGNDDANARDAFVTLADRVGPVLADFHLGDDASDAGEPGSVDFGAPSELARQERDFLRSDLTLTVPGRTDDVVIQMYSDGQRLHFYDGTSDPALFIEPYDTLAHIATRGFGVRDTLRHGRGALTVGYDVKGDQAQFAQTFGAVASASPAADATSAWYASDEERVGAGVTATIAVRHERPQGFASTTVPSAGVMWTDPASGWGVRANYGRAFRTPALEETSPFFFGTPTLEPEYAATFDVGASDGRDSVTYFGTQASNLIVSEPPLFTPENVSEAEIRGIEAAVVRRLGGGITADLGYTDYLRAQDLTTGSRLPFRPTATGSLRLSESTAAFTSVGATLDYVGRRYADDPNTVLMPQYATVGAFVSERIGARSTATLRVDDLTGERVESVPGYPVEGTTVSFGMATTW